MAAELRRRMAFSALFRVFKPGTPGLGRRLAAIPRMMRASMRGEYDGGGRLAMMALAGVYIISPIDLVPELFFLVFGLIDDAAMAAYFAGALLDETERFLEWERRRANVIPGVVVEHPPGQGGSHPGHPGQHPGRPGPHPGHGGPHAGQGHAGGPHAGQGQGKPHAGQGHHPRV